MTSDYVRAYNNRTQAYEAGNSAVASGMRAQAAATRAQTAASQDQARSLLSLGIEQIRSNEFIQSRAHRHEREVIQDGRRYAEQERQRSDVERMRFLSYRHAATSLEPSLADDPDTLEYLWRHFEADHRASHLAQFDQQLRQAVSRLQESWARLAPERDWLASVRSTTTSRRFWPWAAFLAVCTLISALGSVVGFVFTAAVLGIGGFAAVRRYRTVLPNAPSSRSDLLLVAAGRALPPAALVAGVCGISADTVLFSLGSIALASWTLAKRKSFYGMEAEQADLDARMAFHQQETASLQGQSFEPWYEEVRRQPLDFGPVR